VIAFYRQEESTPSTPHVRRARRLVASTFLQRQGDSADSAPPVAAWKAWLLAAWVVAVTLLYFAGMLGLL